MDEVVIGFDEVRLYVAIILTLAVFIMLSTAMRRMPLATAERTNRFMGVLIVGLMALNHPILALNDHLHWDIHNALPLHLCSVTYLLVALNCFLKNRTLWMITLFWGIIGGVHSILTPQLTHGDSPYFLFFYYFKHGAILMMPLIHRQLWGFKLGKRDWINTLVVTNIYVVFSFGVNWLLNRWFPGAQEANYFYTWEPPQANNPIIQGDWPWYLIPCEIALVVHLVLIQFIFMALERRRERTLIA
jgi:hypothetical integral membrane protein (TIGR02206 family)